MSRNKSFPPHRPLVPIKIGGTETQVLYIAVPGVNTATPDQWHDGANGSFLTSIGCAWADHVAVYYHDNQLWSDETSSWRTVEEEGTDFLEALLDLTEHQKLRDCPIILFSHSLGGLIVKRAIRSSYRQSHNTRYTRLLQNIRGAVFLACPHPRSDDEAVWEKLEAIFKNCAKPRARSLQVRVVCEDTHLDSKDSEAAFSNHDIPILTLCETVQSAKAGLFRRKKSLLVHRDFAAMNTRTEDISTVRADHISICRIRESDPAYSRISSFIDQKAWQTFQDISKENGSTADIEVSTVPSQYSFSDGTSQRLPQSRLLSVSQTPVTTITPEFPCVLIPFARNYEFYGRSGILSTLISTLHGPLTDGDSNMHNNRSRLKAFGICGPGGIGKSQVAAEFAYRALQDRLFDAIFWIRANESGSLFGDIQKVATKLGLMNEEPSVRLHAKVLSRLLSWLSRPQKPARDARQLETATWLIVFDDVQSADTLRNVLPTGNGSILITSRDPNIVQSFTQSEKHWLSLPPLTDVDATRFLLKETKRDISPAEWASAADVARVLGYYPFAIHHMASVISNQDLSFPTFRRQYEVAKDRSRLFSSQFGQRNAGPEYHHTMATVWKLDDLREGVCLLDVISLLDSEGIPEIILQQNSACEGWDEYPTPDNFVSARLELSRTSLITRDRDTEVIKCYTIVQDAVRANMDDARFTDIYRHVSCMLSAAWRYEDRFGFGDANARWDGPNGCDVLFSHVLQLRNHFSRFNTNAVLTDESLQLYRLTLDAAWFSIMQSKFTETTPLLDMAEMIHEGIQVESGADPKVREEFERQERIYHHHRGTLALHTNVPTESLHQLKIFVEMTKAKFGDCPDGKDQSMGVGWNELGNAHLQNDDIEQAEACFKKSILALRNIDGAGEIVVSMPLINLAFALWLSGRLEEAASTFEQAYNERVKHHSKSDNTSFTMGKLLLGWGNVLYDQGHLLRSFELHSRALMRYEATVGDYHNRTGDACVRLSDHLIRFEEYEAALKRLNQALAIFGHPEHSSFNPEKARAYYKKGRVLTLQGQSGEAETAYGEAMKLYKKIRPNDPRPREQLDDSDFDKCIMFWSR